MRREKRLRSERRRFLDRRARHSSSPAVQQSSSSAVQHFSTPAVQQSSSPALQQSSSMRAKRSYDAGRGRSRCCRQLCLASPLSFAHFLAASPSRSSLHASTPKAEYLYDPRHPSPASLLCRC
eukprot:scaffold1220_cov259-Pinguiococcus_pyrenoidosus.AAC.69